jgi:hypothetical protein
MLHCCSLNRLLCWLFGCCLWIVLFEKGVLRVLRSTPSVKEEGVGNQHFVCGLE